MAVMPAQERRRTERADTAAPLRRRRRWRWWLAGVVLLVIAVHLAGGWYFSGRIDSQVLAARPGTMTPAYDDAVVVSTDGIHVTLRRGPDAGSDFEAPASYGLAWHGGTGHAGPAVVGSDGTVTRTLDLVTGVAPRAGQAVALERAYYLGDPQSALGLPTREVTIAGMPAWYVLAGKPSARTVAIFVHGQNGTRMDGLRFVEAAHQAGVAVLVISYRNDAGAPTDPSGRLQYGLTEWRDLDAAVAWARGQGLRHVVLAGQSMGGAVVAAFLEHSTRRSAVTGLVLDAPMLSLSRVVADGAQTALPGGLAVPGTVLWAAERFTTLRYGVDWRAVDYLDDTRWLTVPTLVTHGTADPTVPVTTSEQLRAARPRLVRLVEFPGAMHAESWNSDMLRWNDVVAQFLGRLAR